MTSIENTGRTGLGEIDRTGGRVSVGDKAMINARADVNRLLPLKYGWAWEKYLAGCNNHWKPTEVAMQADIALHQPISATKTTRRPTTTPRRPTPRRTHLRRKQLRRPSITLPPPPHHAMGSERPHHPQQRDTAVPTPPVEVFFRNMWI
jgi:hypothetical protein